MRSAIGLAAALGLVGCTFSGGSLPPSSSEITGTLVNRTASNNANLVPEVMDVPAEGTTLRFRFDDGSETEVTTDLDGKFSVPRATSGYLVELTAGTTVVELREEASELVLGGVFAGRQAEPVTELTPIQLPLFPDPPTGIVLASVGQWTLTPANLMSEIDWRAATPTGGFDVGLLDSATDRLFALQYADGVLVQGQAAIARVATAAVDMRDGDRVDLSDSAPLPQVPDTCVRLDASNESMVSRFADALGDGYGAPQRQWSIAAVPSLETQVVGAATLTAASATMFEFSVEAPFTDPFPNHALLVNASAAARRSVTLGPAATGEVIDAVVQAYPANRADKCDSNAVSLVDDGIAIVTSVELDGIALASDQQIVSVPRPDDVKVAWTSSGATDYYDVQLVEVVEESGKLRFDVGRGFRTRLQEISIAESLLVRGHFYVIRVFAITGSPAAAEGNYLDVTYPTSRSVHTSRVFRVE